MRGKEREEGSEEEREARRERRVDAVPGIFTRTMVWLGLGMGKTFLGPVLGSFRSQRSKN